MRGKTLIAVMLTGTVCAVILTFIIATALQPPNTLSETSRVKTFELLIYILGIVSGYLLGKTDEPPPPPKPPEKKPDTPP